MDEDQNRAQWSPVMIWISTSVEGGQKLCDDWLRTGGSYSQILPPEPSNSPFNPVSFFAISNDEDEVRTQFPECQFVRPAWVRKCLETKRLVDTTMYICGTRKHQAENYLSPARRRNKRQRESSGTERESPDNAKSLHSHKTDPDSTAKEDKSPRKSSEKTATVLITSSVQAEATPRKSPEKNATVLITSRVQAAATPRKSSENTATVSIASRVQVEESPRKNSNDENAVSWRGYEDNILQAVSLACAEGNQAHGKRLLRFLRNRSREDCHERWKTYNFGLLAPGITWKDVDALF